MRIIEFTGIPGSGKSSLLPIIKKYYSKAGIEIYDRFDIILNCKEIQFKSFTVQKIIDYFPSFLKKNFYGFFNRILNIREKYAVEFLLNNFEINDFIIKNIRNSPLPAPRKNLMFRWWLNLVSIYQIGVKYLNSDSFLILEEGFFHKILNYFILDSKDNNFSNIHFYIKRIPPIDYLFLINVDEKTCFERLKNRALPGVLLGKNDGQILEYLEKSKIVIEYALKLMEEKGTKIIKIKNPDNFTVKNILNQLPIIFR